MITVGSISSEDLDGLDDRVINLTKGPDRVVSDAEPDLDNLYDDNKLRLGSKCSERRV